MAEETVDLQRLVVSLEARLKTFDKQMEKLKGQTDKNLAGVEKRFQKAETAISGFGKRTQASLSSLGGNLFAGLNPAALVASLSGAGIAAFAKTAITNLGNIKDQAEQAGVSIREMQELTFAAVSEGFGASDIVGIFQKLNKEIADARVNGGQLADILKANNVPLTDQNGVLRSNKELFLDIVDLIKNAKNAADAQLISQLAMGRSAGELAPLFKLGADGLRELGRQAEAAGFIVEDRLVDSADDFIDNWTRVSETFKKIWQSAAGGALLEFEDFLNKAATFDEFLREWTGKGLINTPLQDITDPGGKAGRDAAKEMADMRAMQSQLEDQWRERALKREQLRADPELDELGRRRLAILDEEIGRYDRLIGAHQKYMESRRAEITVLPRIGVQPGLSSPAVRGTIVLTEADKKAEDAAEKTRETARQKAAADKLALAKATETLFVATQREIALKELEAQAQGKSVYEMERARKEMELMARLEDEHRQYGGAVTDEELANVRLLADAWGNVNQEMAENQQALSELQEVGDTVFGGLEDAIDKFIDTGKLDFKAMIASMIKDLAKLSIHNLLGAIQNGSSGSGSGGVMGWLGSLLPSGRSKAPSQQGSAVPAILKAFQPGAGLSSALPKDVQSLISGGGSFTGVGNFLARGAGNVDARLTDILKTAAERSGMKVQAFSGYRPGDKRFHGKGLATDVNLIGPDGRPLPNYQNPASFRSYEKFAQQARLVQMEKYPELEKDFRWGGYFGGKKGKYGAMDQMHFDLGGRRAGMGGGSWENGLTPLQRSFFPGADSKGMGNLAAYQQQIAASGKGLATSLSKVTAAATSSATDFSGAFGPALQQVVGAVGGGGGGAGGFLGLLQPLLSLIPGLAKGGPVRKGMPYIVGEDRPELFVPSQDGRIVPQVPRLAVPRPAMAAIPNYGGRQQVDVNIRADASPFLLLETDARSARIARAGDGRTLRSAERQAPQRMAQFEKLGT